MAVPGATSAVSDCILFSVYRVARPVFTFITGMVLLLLLLLIIRPCILKLGLQREMPRILFERQCSFESYKIRATQRGIKIISATVLKCRNVIIIVINISK